MGYNKAIVYGDNLELYTYEKNITPSGGKGRTAPSRAGLSDLDIARILAERKQAWKGKRKDNKNRSTMAFRRLILANMAESAPPLLVTVTYSQNQTDPRIGYKDWNSFIGNLRYAFGSQFRYIAVPEFQKRGAIHYHALFWVILLMLFLSLRLLQ